MRVVQSAKRCLLGVLLCWGWLPGLEVPVLEPVVWVAGYTWKRWPISLSSFHSGVFDLPSSCMSIGSLRGMELSSRMETALELPIKHRQLKSQIDHF